MSLRSGELPEGWLTRFRQGVIGGIVLLLLAILLTALPTSLAWLAPGADSTSAGSALRAAAVLAVSFNHGGLVLDGVPVTLVPLLGTLVLGLLVALRAERLESTGSFAGMVLGYTGAVGVVAAMWPLGTTRAPVAHSMLAAFGFALVVGGAARLLPALWSRWPERLRRTVTAAGGAVCVYLAAGSLLALVAFGSHFHQAADLQGRLATGASGLPIALLGIGAVPNAVMAGVGVLTGPGFDLGTATHVSAFGVHRGLLPAFPLLAALPVRPLGVGLGIVLLAGVALAAGLVVRRLLLPAPAVHAVTDGAVAAAIAGVALAVIAELAGGRMGPGALRHVGPVGWVVGLCAFGLISLGTGAVVGLAWLMGRRRSLVSVSVELAPRAGGGEEPQRHPVRRPFVRRSASAVTSPPGAATEPAAASSTGPGGLRRTG